MKMTLSIRFMLEHFSRLESLGFSRGQALTATNLTEAGCNDVNRRVSLSTLADLYNAAETDLSDANIGLNAGFDFRVSTYTKTGNIYGYCRDLPEVIRLNTKYQQIAIDAGEVAYEQMMDAETGQIRHFMSFRPYVDDVETYRHVIDFIVGAYFTAYRWLIWSSGDDIKQIDLPYDAPADTSEHERLFGCSIRFNQPYLRLEFSEKTMMHELPTYDAAKLARSEAHLLTLLASRKICDGLKLDVKSAMRASLENGKMGTHIIAEQMGKTWSVLRRQLVESDLSYRDLLEKTRKEMFHEYLEQGQNFSEIAQALGYNDQAAFSKAFKRWYGVSPRQWKAAYQISQSSRPGYKVVD